MPSELKLFARILAVIFLVTAGFALLLRATFQPLPVYGTLSDFSLTERSGTPLTRRDLAGSPWIADFIFTRCQGPCPYMTDLMRRLQLKLKARPQIHLVSFTVDPEWDTPQVLSSYAEGYQADRKQWLFVTGKKTDIFRLAEKDFKLNAGREEETIFHSSKLVLVDSQSRIRGFYDGEEGREDPKLFPDLKRLLREERVTVLPEINGTLNFLSALFLLAGYVFIRRRNLVAHRAAMVSALMSSALFLSCYLFYHAHYGSIRYIGSAVDKTLYLLLLGSHTVLAIVIVPMILRSLFLIWKGRAAEHARLNRWTFPLWLYVSVTGVAVYWSLYQ